MLYFSSWESYDGVPCAVMLGKFDGLHLGHRALLSKMREDAGTLRRVILSIEPVQTSRDEIFTFSEKRELCRDLGFQAYVSLPFDDALKSMVPERFVKEVLKERIHAERIYVGDGFRFGKDRSGDTGLLCSVSHENGMEVTVVPSVLSDGITVSSTAIRELISLGKTDLAAKLLGIPYFVSGNTVEGRHLGRELHFPTLNLVPEKGKLLPPHGVYHTETEYMGGTYPSVTNVGVNPSVKSDGVVSVETHLLRTPAESIPYGAFVRVNFFRQIRPERKFASLEELSRQIAADKQTVEKTIYKQ